MTANRSKRVHTAEHKEKIRNTLKGRMPKHPISVNLPIGTERKIKDGSLIRKVSEDLRPYYRNWKPAHVVRWEEVNGPVPTGHVLRCLDGDKENTRPDNWTLASRKMLPTLNGFYDASGHRSISYAEAPDELKPVVLAVAKLKGVILQHRKAKL